MTGFIKPSVCDSRWGWDLAESGRPQLLCSCCVFTEAQIAPLSLSKGPPWAQHCTQMYQAVHINKPCRHRPALWGLTCKAVPPGKDRIKMLNLPLIRWWPTRICRDEGKTISRVRGWSEESGWEFLAQPEHREKGSLLCPVPALFRGVHSWGRGSHPAPGPRLWTYLTDGRCWLK